MRSSQNKRYEKLMKYSYRREEVCLIIDQEKNRTGMISVEISNDYRNVEVLRRQGRLLSRFIINSVRRVAKAPLPAHTQRERAAPPAATTCWRYNSLLYQIRRPTHAPHMPHGTPTRGVRCSITTTPDYFEIYEERRKHCSIFDLFIQILYLNTSRI